MTGDPFGVLAKSQLPDGSYKPANQLSAEERRGVDSSATSRSIQGQHRQALPNAHRDVGEVYGHHAFGLSHKAVGEMATHATIPSAVHPKIEYAHTVPSRLRDRLDATMSRAHTDRLPHPVVIHHHKGLEAETGYKGGALRPHVTTGGKGRVVVDGREADSDVLHHELAHAAVRGSNAGREQSHRRVIGEEARADATSRTNLYVRGGVVGRRRTVARVSGIGPRRLENHLARSIGNRTGQAPDHPDVREGARLGAKGATDSAATQMRYHQVQAAVRRAARLKKSDDGASEILVSKRRPDSRDAAAGALTAGAGGAAVRARRLGGQARKVGAEAQTHRAAGHAGMAEVEHRVLRLQQGSGPGSLPRSNPGNWSNTIAGAHKARLHMVNAENLGRDAAKAAGGARNARTAAVAAVTGAAALEATRRRAGGTASGGVSYR